MNYPKNGMIVLLAILLVSAGLLNACGRDDPYADVAPENLVGQVKLPPLPSDGEKPRMQVQNAATQNSGPGFSTQKPPAEPIKKKLPDFSQYQSVQEKKKAFFSYLRPIVEKENWRVLKERAYVLLQWKRFQNGRKIEPEAVGHLRELAEKYRVKAEFEDGTAFFRQLLIHVDKIPVELALVQAAKESAWGISYFARKGNNLFGQWCFEKGCGIVPRRRPEGAAYEVRAFDSVAESVRAYILNLNSHPAYKELRIQRYRMRLAGGGLNGHLMAKGLERYSEIGMQYVETVRQMIRGNRKFMGIHGQASGT